MKSIIYCIKNETSDEYAINKRSTFNMIHEWRTHNLLYSFGLLKNRTKDTDLNTN